MIALYQISDVVALQEVPADRVLRIFNLRPRAATDMQMVVNCRRPSVNVTIAEIAFDGGEIYIPANAGL